MPHLFLLHYIHSFARALDSCFSQGEIERLKGRREPGGRRRRGKKEMNENVVKKIKERRKTQRWKEKLGKAEKKKKELDRASDRKRWERKREEGGEKHRVSQTKRARAQAPLLSHRARQLLAAPPQLLSNTEVAAQPLITIPRSEMWASHLKTSTCFFTKWNGTQNSRSKQMACVFFGTLGLFLLRENLDVLSNSSAYD